jgi:hypothetical protein
VPERYSYAELAPKGLAARLCRGEVPDFLLQCRSPERRSRFIACGADARVSEHDPEKWVPVFGKVMLQTIG